LEDILDNLGPLPADAVDAVAATRSALMATGPVDEDASTPETPAPTDGGLSGGLSDRQRAILAALDGEAAAVDAIIDRTGLSAQLVLQELTFLTLRGAVKRVGGQTYARRR
jgi:predicted Rossmann fold nucleotide-binding protein DprA/Smf involved in DNA uptake